MELEPELQAALRGKGYPIVGNDFLSFWPDEKYDLIVMNPPFADGEKHLLHAWEILAHGDILCLLNEQTLQNPYSVSRQLLCKVIADHGTVTPLGSCFTEAERTTEVRVSLVHLTKPAQKLVFSFMQEGQEEDADIQFKEQHGFESEVATRNLVGNMVINSTVAARYSSKLPIARKSWPII